MTTAAHPADQLCRLTVAAPGGRADLAVPQDIPLAELLPVLLRHVDPGLTVAAGGEREWVLQRLGDTPLDTDATPAALGLRDGEVLHLRPARIPLPAIGFDDLTDGVGVAIRGRADRWRPELTRWLFLGLAATALLVLLLALLTVPGPLWLRATGSGAVAVLLLAAGAIASRAIGDAPVAAQLGLAAAPFAAVAGSLVPGTGFGAPNLLGAGSAAMAATVLAVLAVRTAVPVFLATGVAAVAAALGGLLVLWSKLSPGGSAAVVATVAFGLTMLAPGVATRMVRLRPPQLPGGAEELQEDIEPLSEPEVLAKAKSADRLLTALLAGSAVVVAACLLPVVAAPGWTAPAFLAAMCAALLLRSRVLVSTGQRLAVALPGAAGFAVLLHAGAHAPLPALRVISLVGLAVLAALLVLGAWRLPGKRLLPYWGRAADLGETAAAIAVVPLLLAVLDAYALIRALAG
ncbi:type VII secretion integral membrane protein EccD [Crossiella sp. SN42]|uniref:type VII secretion integral membrane protein EccD n=1 Tax=Crossiella sp. SN42 TaxID=2944808 RepID=UPI00207CE28F|nr:type VII secretion integral membrane protein EccD [Crossiella sp. SN42]MCO1580743.1 type VII secretion integral membrane protein EccD [Crossiella sp. SN42]